MCQGRQRLLKTRRGFAVGQAGFRPGPGLPAIDEGLVPQLAPYGVVGQAVCLLGQPIRVEGFEGLDEDLAQGYYEEIVQAYTAFADFVVVGQRGIGPSKPNTLCASVRTGPTAYSRQCRAYWEAKGMDAAGFTVIEAAADVADAAHALGYQRIVLRGGSFGSHWAIAVMRYHPELVVRALLSGTEGPDHTYDSPTGILSALKRIAAAAEQSPALTAVIPRGGLIGALETVRERLERAPVSVTVSDSQTGTRHTLEFTERDVPGFATGYTSGLGSRRGAA